ncbi:MAG: methylglyoxal synthase [Oscillospiraceae bacterium]|jgi:methylglyoxal synthase|nr:methylglyoxal synthase [Oscillospiraceae bacterium]
MNIALIAHDKRKDIMVQFCVAYCGIFSKHTLCATNTTGRFVSEATGLPIKQYLTAAQGGVQQIGARIPYNELDLVLYFCDPSASDNENVNELARLCDRYNVPFASNIATAEALVLALGRGDLDWRL